MLGLNWSFSSELWINVLAAIIVAILSYCLGLMRKSAKTRITYGIFKKVFGDNVTSSDRLAICIPMWNLLKGDRSVGRFISPARPDGESVYGPNDTFAEADARAGFEFGSIFYSIFPEPVKVISSFNLVGPDVTGVLIGAPIANYYVDGIMKSANIDGLPITFESIPETELSQAASIIVSKIGNEHFAYNKESEMDYALLVRLKKPVDSGYYVICAGIDSSGTWGAASWFRARWRSCAEDVGSSALVLRLQRGRPHTVTAIRRYRQQPDQPWERVPLRQGDGCPPNDDDDIIANLRLERSTTSRRRRPRWG